MKRLKTIDFIFIFNNYTKTKIPFMYSFSGNCSASVACNFHFHVSVSDSYIPRIGRRWIVGIYKSLTDIWMWKLGLWPRNFFFWKYLFRIFGIGCLQCDLLWLTCFYFLAEATVAQRICLSQLVPASRLYSAEVSFNIFIFLHHAYTKLKIWEFTGNF